MNRHPAKAEFGGGKIATDSTDFSAALCALGIPHKRTNPWIRRYTKERPPGTVGQIDYRHETFSRKFARTSGVDIAKEWFKDGALKDLLGQLDSLRELLVSDLKATDSKGRSNLDKARLEVDKIEKALPGAIIEQMRIACQVRKKLAGMVKKLQPGEVPWMHTVHSNGVETICPARPKDRENYKKLCEEARKS